MYQEEKNFFFFEKDQLMVLFSLFFLFRFSFFEIKINFNLVYFEKKKKGRERWRREGEKGEHSILRIFDLSLVKFMETFFLFNKKKFFFTN